MTSTEDDAFVVHVNTAANVMVMRMYENSDCDGYLLILPAPSELFGSACPHTPRTARRLDRPAYLLDTTLRISYDKSERGECEQDADGNDEGEG